MIMKISLKELRQQTFNTPTPLLVSQLSPDLNNNTCFCFAGTVYELLYSITHAGC